MKLVLGKVELARTKNGGKASQHRGSIRAPQTTALGLNLDSPKIYQYAFGGTLQRVANVLLS